ncbi:hypothetical protein AQUCO_00700129v1 [Aquilegia coerulea]|uniref:O-methyltransferase C-terminal domain-containing protein n=1 Tax=Aquilegia coerulea TaxID=218851 RepID=A0A2G5EIN8_AQUCA|nr:hypothetical protein AQUCO_00700129v1 [Aquilegia coerulea]
MFKDLLGEMRLLELLEGLYSKLLRGVALGVVKESLGGFEFRQLLAELFVFLVGIISRNDSMSAIFTLLGVVPLQLTTHAAKWLLQDTELTLAPVLLMQKDGMKVRPFHKNVEEGGVKVDAWDKGAAYPEYNERFNATMASITKIAINVLLNYENGFDGIKSLVDVGGGLGLTIGEIVKAHPHISGTLRIHVSGYMFLDILEADAVIIKWILHDYEDEKCVKLLKNCHRVVSKNGGKLIIVDGVLEPDGKGAFDDMIINFDMVMMATTGGKERTETEWKKILECGGFPNYKIIRIPALLSIIEDYPSG